MLTVIGDMILREVNAQKSAATLKAVTLKLGSTFVFAVDYASK